MDFHACNVFFPAQCIYPNYNNNNNNINESSLDKVFLLNQEVQLSSLTQVLAWTNCLGTSFVRLAPVPLTSNRAKKVLKYALQTTTRAKCIAHQ